MIRVFAIVGPTGVGKSEVAVEVAEALGAEIVSVDSMQIYRGMDIGTDKATTEMRARVPHHLLDLRDPDHELSVAEFQQIGRGAIDDIVQRGRSPLLVGGSGLYFRAVVDDLEFPPRSAGVRAALEEKVHAQGAEALHEHLQELDPIAAARIEPNNARRIVRALEVIELTHRPFSDNAAWDRYESRSDLIVAGLDRDREQLYRRVEQRVDRMIAAGLVDEVRRVADGGMSATARQALGYKQVLAAPPGQDLSVVRDDIVRATKRFARRQLSWFKADPRVTWFSASEAGLHERLIAFFRARGR